MGLVLVSGSVPVPVSVPMPVSSATVSVSPSKMEHARSTIDSYQGRQTENTAALLCLVGFAVAAFFRGHFPGRTEPRPV